MCTVHPPKVLSIAFCLFAFVVAASQAHASTNSGFDTPPGVTSLPFAIEGNEMMNLGTAGLAIGTSSAAVAPLDVNGGIRGSNTSTVVVNGACSPEGMLGYDLNGHQAVYCSSSLAWTAIGARFVPISPGIIVDSTCPGSAGHSVNLSHSNAVLASSVPADATAVQVEYALSYGSCACASWISGYIDGTNTTHPAGQMICMAFSTNDENACTGSTLTTPASHIFGTSGANGCNLYVTGYFH